jgi:hypothetical protein
MKNRRQAWWGATTELMADRKKNWAAITLGRKTSVEPRSARTHHSRSELSSGTWAQPARETTTEKNISAAQRWLEIRERPGSLLEQEQRKIPVLLLCSHTRLTKQRQQKSNPCAFCCAHTRINQRKMVTLDGAAQRRKQHLRYKKNKEETKRGMNKIQINFLIELRQDLYNHGGHRPPSLI